MIPVILGPTAVGKTALLLELARRLPIEVVSVDSRQIYRHMDVGTAKPAKSERETLRHWLIDIKNPDEDFDVKTFRELALEAIEDITSRGKIPILAGGTGLYAEALMKGLADVPGRNESVREALTELEKTNPGCLRKMLKIFDSKAYERLHENDLKRSVRYLEAFFLTGRPLSEVQNEKVVSDRFKVIVLNRSRSELHRRIESRVEEMARQGLMEETQRLLAMGYTINLNALKTIGYAEMVQCIRGLISPQEALEKIKCNTRRYARRQIIWFRRYSGLEIDLSNLAEYCAVSTLERTILLVWGGNYG
jgi:tRNA dimethylallyltransferase